MSHPLRRHIPGTKPWGRAASILPAVSLLCLVAAACGGRLKPLPGSDIDAGTPDGGFDLDAGEDAADAAADAPPPNPCGSAAPAPGCVLKSTCSSTYFATWTIPFYGGWVGVYPYETVTIECKTNPSTVEQYIDGQWVPLEMWVANAGALGTIGRPITVYDVDSTAGTTAIPSAQEPTGSTHQFRACMSTTIATSGACSDPSSVSVVEECDPPTSLAIAACVSCAPVICPDGYETLDGCHCIVIPPIYHPTGG